MSDDPNVATEICYKPLLSKFFTSFSGVCSRDEYWRALLRFALWSTLGMGMGIFVVLKISILLLPGGLGMISLIILVLLYLLYVLMPFLKKQAQRFHAFGLSYTLWGYVIPSIPCIIGLALPLIPLNENSTVLFGMISICMWGVNIYLTVINLRVLFGTAPIDAKLVHSARSKELVNRFKKNPVHGTSVALSDVQSQKELTTISQSKVQDFILCLLLVILFSIGYVIYSYWDKPQRESAYECETATPLKCGAMEEDVHIIEDGVDAQLKSIMAEIENEKAILSQLEKESAHARSMGDEYKDKSDTLKIETIIVERELWAVVSRTAPVVDLDPDSFEPAEIIAAAKALMDENIELQSRIDAEKDQIATLGAESDRLNGLIDAARKLVQERQARISPSELKCSVTYVAPGYAFITLNAGIDNAGVVIGSRLAVMRGDKKICELNVTNVQARESIAYVVKGSMKKGERVKVGDIVVSVKNK